MSNGIDREPTPNTDGAPSPASQIRIHAGPAGNARRRTVIALDGNNEVLRDTLDTNDQRRRRAFIAALVERLNPPPDDLDDVDSAICRAADATDEGIENCATQESVDPTVSGHLQALVSTIQLFRAPFGDGYAICDVNGVVDTLPLDSQAFRDWLVYRYYQQYGLPAGTGPITSVVALLQARARYEAEQRPLRIRVAEYDDGIAVDLCDPERQVIIIRPTGWSLSRATSIPFVRPSGASPLPIPERGGHINDLRPFVNVTDDDWPLVVAWLAAAFRPSGAYPILVLQGPHGAAKSTLARVLRSLVDPHGVMLRSCPANREDLMIASSRTRIISLDNLSRLTNDLSDALCCLSTGGGFATRTRYTSSDETTFDALRPIMLNGIEDFVHREDLLDRERAPPPLLSGVVLCWGP